MQRVLLPGLAFKASVIGGGYATGRELAEYFLPSGPRGGLLAMLLATCIWSLVCSLTFLLAFNHKSFDYRRFFQVLVGPLWVVFEMVYVAIVILLLSVFGAAAGAVGTVTLGVPHIVGTVVLMACISVFAALGNSSVDRVFKYVSVLLYGTYALFLGLGLARFGPMIAASFAAPVPATGWLAGGITYASYNVVGAVMILPATRHVASRRDAVVAGMIAGPLAMGPAIAFFLCMTAFYPAIGTAELPATFLLERIGHPWLQVLFQVMIFAALVECGTGAVHAVNERIASAQRETGRAELSRTARLGIIVLIIVMSVYVANRFGLIALIAHGFRAMAYVIIAVYLLPLLWLTLRRLYIRRPVASAVSSVDGGAC